MLTVKEVAEKLGAGVSSVRLWAKQKKFPGAKKMESALGSYYVIPETDLENFTVRKRGRPGDKPEPSANSKSTKNKGGAT